MRNIAASMVGWFFSRLLIQAEVGDRVRVSLTTKVKADHTAFAAQVDGSLRRKWLKQINKLYMMCKNIQ